MRVFNLGTLKAFWERVPNTETALREWYKTMRRGHFTRPADVSEQVRQVSVIDGNYLLFKRISANRIRLLVRVDWRGQAMYVVFLGTHSEYDKHRVEDLVKAHRNQFPAPRRRS